NVKLIARDSDILVKLQPLILPVFEQLHPILRPAKIFQLHLLELAGAEGEVARINFVAKRFPDLGDAERQFLARHFEDIFELNEDCLRSEEHTSELQSRFDLVCRLLLEKKNKYDNS